VHNQYWDDDLPLLYFSDIRDRPAYCSAHVQPLEALSTDLAQAATTPNLAWIGTDDCFDMEGCGIRAGMHSRSCTAGQRRVRLPDWGNATCFAAAVVDTYGGQLSLINLKTGHMIAPITVGAYPVAVAFAR